MLFSEDLMHLYFSDVVKSAGSGRKISGQISEGTKRKLQQDFVVNRKRGNGRRKRWKNRRRRKIERKWRERGRQGIT